MDAFDMPDLVAEHARLGQLYHEFFRTGTLSLGLYKIAAGEKDPQVPHTEDEVYYIVEGRGMIQVAGEDRPVFAGSTVFVGIGVDHRFHSITEDMTILVFWAPPRRSRATKS